jgi:acyl carrier protein
LSEPTFHSAVDLISSAIQCDAASLTPDSRLAAHPNWDSIAHLNVMMLLEQEFGIEINDVTIDRFTTLAAVQELFAGRAG